MTKTQRSKQLEWLNGLFDSVDQKDTKRFLSYLSPGSVFRFGSAPPVTGREQIAVAVDGFFATINGSSHRLINTWFENDAIACEGEVTYRRADGTEITLPFATIFDMAGELISCYKIYIDIGPLYAE